MGKLIGFGYFRMCRFAFNFKRIHSHEISEFQSKRANSVKICQNQHETTCSNNSKNFAENVCKAKAMHKIGTRVEKCMRDQINSASGIHSNHTLVAVIRLHFSMCTLGVSAHTHRFVYLVVELKIGMCFAECNQHPHPIQIFIWIWMFFGIFFSFFVDEIPVWI